MSISSLSHTFRRLTVLGRGVCTKVNHTTYKDVAKIAPLLTQSTKEHEKQLNFLNFTPRSINLDVGFPGGPSINKIIESPLKIINEIENPTRLIIEKIDIVSDKTLDLPATENGNDSPMEFRWKRRLNSIILIRRKKIKKHKRRKMRRRREAALRKINKRRGVKREKMFQAELWAKVKEAQKFDAKEYVASRIELLNRVRIPPIYKGYVIPEAMVKKLMEEDAKKAEQKKKHPPLKL